VKHSYLEIEFVLRHSQSGWDNTGQRAQRPTARTVFVSRRTLAGSNVFFSTNQCCGSGSGIGCLFDLCIRDPGWEKVSEKSASGSGIWDEQPGSYFLDLRNHFLLFLGFKYLNSLMRIRDLGWRQFGSGIRDGKKSDPGSGINIPDPPHCNK
jgi:hypothetical protein